MARPGELVDKGPLIPEIDFSRYRMRIPTERYSPVSSSSIRIRKRRRLPISWERRPIFWRLTTSRKWFPWA